MAYYVTEVAKARAYQKALPVTAAVVGIPKLDHIDDNVRLAKAFQPLPPSEMKRMGAELSDKNKQPLDLFFRDHVDG